MATASELTPRVERLEEEMIGMKQTFQDYKLESVIELTKIAERQSGTYKATEDIKGEIKTISHTINQVQNQSSKEKANWYDRIVEYIILALLGFILVKIGLK